MTLPFDQRPDESSKAFEAFCCYRDMRADRTIDAVAQKCNKSRSIMARWASRHDWVDRARSYDAAMDAKLRRITEQDAIKQRRQMLKEHADEARRLRTMSRRVFDEFERRWGEKGTLQWIAAEDFVKIISQVAKWVQTAHQLERLAMGEPSDNIQPPKPFDEMTTDELHDYVERLRAVMDE